jgi:hypothetical protein
MHHAQNQSLMKTGAWLQNGSTPDANLSAAGGSLATEIQGELVEKWNAVSEFHCPGSCCKSAVSNISVNHANCCVRADGSSTEDAKSVLSPKTAT